MISKSVSGRERGAATLTDAEIQTPDGPPPLPRETAATEPLETAWRIAEDPLENVPLPPEIVSPELKNLKTWDDAQEEFGIRAPATGGDDESVYAEVFVEEGLDEAEEERRTVQENEERVTEEEETEIDEAKARAEEK